MDELLLAQMYALLTALGFATSDVAARYGLRSSTPISGMLMGPVVEPILKAAEESRNFEELRERLLELLPELNDRELIKRLERNGFTAHLSGDAGLG